jgi:hypothetical protein
VLTDASSFGILVWLGNQNDRVLPRPIECTLAGSGHIVPGCERANERAPFIAFSLKSQWPLRSCSVLELKSGCFVGCKAENTDNVKTSF